ncbi:hypothetical protein [Streptomyces sp. c-19]|uniref:hypothetical protein n=1 Tax=Streptomyces sp. c-19 TaxID=2789275 RepID=UPI00397FC2C8
MTHSLGSVSAPCGVLVLAMAGALGCWADTERPLSARGLDAAGQVCPVTLAPRDGSTVLRWTIPPYDEEAEE